MMKAFITVLFVALGVQGTAVALASNPQMTCTLSGGQEQPAVMTFHQHHKCCTSANVPGSDEWALDFVYWSGDVLKVYLRNRNHNPLGLPEKGFPKVIGEDEKVEHIRGEISLDPYLPGKTLFCDEQL